MGKKMQKLQIIAECAQGYEGDPHLSKLLAHGALKAGADWIKYQLVYGDELCVPTYQYYELFSNLEMQDSDWMEISNIVHDGGKRIAFDIYGEQSLKKAYKFGADAIKISTTDFYNTILIKSALQLFETVFISIGGIVSDHIQDLYDLIPEKNNVIFLYGYQSEPTPTEGNNLARFFELKRKFPNVNFGFMDHSEGKSNTAFDLSKVALGCGVNVIEKHITISHVLELEDHISAINLDEFKMFTEDLRILERSLGDGDLTLSDEEAHYSAKASKVAVAANHIEAGIPIKSKDLVLKRVTTEPDLSHFKFTDPLIGKKLLTSKEKNEPICSGDF